jgi:excisionase family DNA binding protein
MTDERPPVTVTELATRTGMHRNTVIRDIKEGNLPAERAGNQYIIKAADADAYADARSMVLRGEKALAGLRQRAQERISKRGHR